MGYNAYYSNERKKRKRIIICSVIAAIVIVIAAGAFAVYNWQKNNITALRYVVDYSADEIADQIVDSDKQTQERLSEIAGIPLRPLTKEESKLLAEGEITQEEAVSLITGKTTLEEIQSKKNPVSEKKNGGNSGDGNSGNRKVDISSTLAKIYALEGEFTSSIESLISQAREELGSMSTADLMRKYSGIAASMENDCDSRMEALLSELGASGGDKSIIDEIRDAYENKKSLKKAELISRFGN